MKPLTNVILVLDKSGSMFKIKDAAISGFNEQIQQFKENSSDQDIRISIITFNGEITEHTWCSPVETMNEITSEEYKPAGATAMFDAMGYSIKKMMDTTEGQDAAYLMIIISDGETNSDKQFNSSQVQSLIKDCQGSGKWTFSYIGCTAAALESVSKSVGIPMANMAQWTADTDTGVVKGLKSVAQRSKQYFTKRSSGDYRDINYMSDASGCSANFTEVPLNVKEGTEQDLDEIIKMMKRK